VWGPFFAGLLASEVYDDPTVRAMTPTDRRPHQRCYADDPRLCDRVFELLDTWIPALSGERRGAERLRGRWEDCSTPFVRERDGRVISHVGLLETTVACGETEILTGGVHAVCTLAAFRRQGLYRTLIEEVLTYCDERYTLVKLSTAHPEYYEPFDFRVVSEHRFRVAVASRGGRRGFRELDRDSENDLDTLDRVLSERVPVSRVFAVARDDQVFKFNASQEPLHYCEALDLIALMTVDGTTLEVHDVLAARMPDLDTLLAEIEAPIDEVIFYFRPDRLGVDGTPERFRFDGDVLMLRGDCPEDGQTPRELMLPPMARH